MRNRLNNVLPPVGLNPSVLHLFRGDTPSPQHLDTQICKGEGLSRPALSFEKSMEYGHGAIEAESRYGRHQ